MSEVGGESAHRKMHEEGRPEAPGAMPSRIVAEMEVRLGGPLECAYCLFACNRVKARYCVASQQTSKSLTIWVPFAAY